MSATIDEQFIEYIVKSLVGKPDEVKLSRTIDEKGVLLELTVDPEDLGRVIGKRGATAQSLRTLLRALGTKNEARYNLKIVDNGYPKPDRPNREDQPARQDDRSSDWDNTSDNNTTASSDEPTEQPPVTTVSDDNDDDAWSTSTRSSAPKADEDNNEDMIAKTRRELDDLDDLDV
ncbi:MAG: KH domain-containing protein [bacterium]|nr:KH domain-containing protein [bacterium]